MPRMAFVSSKPLRGIPLQFEPFPLRPRLPPYPVWTRSLEQSFPKHAGDGAEEQTNQTHALGSEDDN